MIGHYDDQLEKVDDRWLIARRWVAVENLAEDPNFDVLSVDAEISIIKQRLFSAFERLGDQID